MFNKFLIFCLTCLFISLNLSAQQGLSKAVEKEVPLFFLDGKAISQEEMQAIDPNEVAALTILKDDSAKKQYGKKGKAGVILIETKKQSRDHFQKYFASKSSGYKSLLEEKRGSDITFAYLLDGKLLTENYEGDLAAIADSTFKSIEVIDSMTLVENHNITNKSKGVLITTGKGSTKKASSNKYNFEPQLLILAPGKTSFSPQAAKEIDKIDAQLKTDSKEVSAVTADTEDLEENLRLMKENAASFISKLDFFKQISLISQSYLAYRFYERFPKTLILVKDAKVEDATSLAELAESERMPYILGFPSVKLVKEKSGYVVYLRVQLYEQESNSLLIDKEYKGDDNNPGFEFSCKEGSLNCTLNNALSEGLKDVIAAIAGNNATLKAEKSLLAERIEFIKKDLYPKTFDASLLAQAIPAGDNSIDFKNLYQCLYSPQKDKFVAFFCGPSSDKNFKSMSESKKDGHVNIISSKDIKDKGFLDEMPGVYAYIVRGLRFKDRWYYKKDKVTYFDPQDEMQGKLEFLTNLHQWNYFEKDTAKPDSNFWHAQLFERVPNLREDPKWEQYKEMWELSEKENRDYIGMYELVALALRSEKEEKEKAWQDSIRRHVLAPFYQEQIKTGKNGFNGNSSVLEESELIYNKSKTHILNPEEVKDAKGSSHIRFFLLVPATGNIYEWTYFPPFQKKKGNAETGIMPNLNTITKWDYSFDTLDDENFWTNYVLLQENGEYKYLTKLK